MTMRRGRCNNIGLCENATRQRIIEVPEGEPFVCPKCEAELTAVSDRKVQRSASSVALPIVAITLAVIGVAFGVWDLYLRPAATPVAQTTVPAQPQMAAAVPTPAPASAPAPEAAAPAPPVAASATSPATASTPPQTASETAPPVQAAPAPASAPPSAPRVAEAVQAPAAPTPSVPAPAPQAAVPEAAPAPATPAPVAAAPSDPAQRVQTFLGNATRVPFTFNFRTSVVDLTGHSERELERLVGYLKQHHATGDRVYLAGFTDNQGDPAANEAVSQKRVAAVAAALTQAGITPAHVASFGPDMPVADNATQAGRDRNRRVEVYLAP